MTDAANLTHEQFAEMLPDYVLGALSDDEYRLIEDHLTGCEQCRLEFAALLQTTSLIVDAGRPSSEVWNAISERIAPYRSWPAQPNRQTTIDPPRQPESRSLRPRRQWAAWSVAAIALAMALSFGVWNILLQWELREEGRIASLITEPDGAYTLTDTDLESGANGVLYVDRESDEALLLASGLEPLPDTQRYQVWLFTEDGGHVSAGIFSVDASGTGTGLVQAPAPMLEYWAVALSAEPVTGSTTPTSPLALGGWIQ